MKTILFALLTMIAALPAQNLGQPFARWVDGDAVVTAHTNGMTKTYDDTSQVIVTMTSTAPNGTGGQYTTTWNSTVNGVVVPITVTYAWPTPNPTKAQRRLYRARFREEVTEMLLLFPAVP